MKIVISKQESSLAEIIFLLQLNNVSKRVSVVDEDNHMDDDWDMSRTHQGDDIDLFDDGEESHSSANGTQRQKGDNGDAPCAPGKDGS